LEPEEADIMLSTSQSDTPAGRVRRPHRTAGILLAVVAALLVPVLPVTAPALAQDGAPAAPPASTVDQHLPSIWDLQLGAHWSAISSADFIDFACGTNGGPPSTRIDNWSGFGRCAPDADTGLREIYFEYDDEQEYIGRARNLDLLIMRYEYTWVNGLPVIASALFDDDGFLAGIRMVTDPRVDLARREKGMILGGFMFARFGEAGWDCTDLPRLPGESPFLDIYIKRDCTKTVTDAKVGDVRLRVQINNFRRPGQHVLAWDNVPTEGEFESTTRFQAVLANPVRDEASRLAAIATPPVNPLIEKVMNCPGCDLRGVNLKRLNLTGAKLAGADLTGANLHATILATADLSGATLDGANLNRADLRRANLEKATLQKVMMFGGLFDGINLSGANLNGAMAGSIRLPRANLSGASVRAVDLRDSRLNDADFTGADLTSSWMHNAQVTRADFSRAILIYLDAKRANFAYARFGGADARGADFFGASFRDADLGDADFSYTRLTSANLFAARLAGANLAESDLPAGFRLPAAVKAP